MQAHDALIVRVCLFAHVDADGWIGYNNCLADEFKGKVQGDMLREVVRNKTVIVGRKSFVSTFGRHPPGARVIVMTRTADEENATNTRSDVTFARTPLEALSKCLTIDAVVIGGARTFWSFLPYASEFRVCAMEERVRRPDTLRSIAAAQWAEAVPELATAEQRDGFLFFAWAVDKPAREPADEPSKPYWENPKGWTGVSSDCAKLDRQGTMQRKKTVLS